jgi:hypothetical protein
MTPPPPGPPSREGWRRRARAVFAERLGLKVTALVVALLLWFVVRVVRVAGGAP